MDEIDDEDNVDNESDDENDVLEVDVEKEVVDCDADGADEVVDLDVDVEDEAVVDERVQDDDGKDELETVVANVDDDMEVPVEDVAIVVRKLVVPEWLLPIQDEDVGRWVVGPNDDKMRKHSDMMQVGVVHCGQVFRKNLPY